MVNIKRFVDRVSTMDNQSNRDVVLPAQEARALRDEIVKLLADRVENSGSDVVEIVMSGGKF
jgi:hypothetical protein